MLFDGLARRWWSWCGFHVGYHVSRHLTSRTNLYRGVVILFGGLLLILSSILEFVIGNTFPSVVFGHLGMFCQSKTDDRVACADTDLIQVLSA